MNEIIGPEQVEAAIHAISNRIANGVRVCSNAERDARAAAAVHDRAYAAAYLAADGPAHEKKYRAELATGAERDARDVAELAQRHADRLARALESELRAMQSIGASIRSMFGVVGRGES